MNVFENLSKPLTVAFLFLLFCLCPPGSFCFIAFDDGLKTGGREEATESIFEVSMWSFFLGGHNTV